MVVKPLDLQQTIGWKDEIHIFRLAPTSTLCDQWFGYSKGRKNQTHIEHARNQIRLQFLQVEVHPEMISLKTLIVMYHIISQQLLSFEGGFLVNYEKAN